ncbi:MAG: S-layer homology domain-containing protein [Defluviitaleaceae bacterium]|nr:S-layer homology domain-containing protein [Defluviitaleaceae bacterium]
MRFKSLICVLCVVVLALPNFVVGYAAAPARIFVEQALGERGERIRITVSIVDNPGIASFGLYIEYDSSRMALVDIVRSNSVLRSFTMVRPDAGGNPVNLIWYAGRNTFDNGRFLFLDFEVFEDAQAGRAFINIAHSYQAITGTQIPAPTILESGGVIIPARVVDSDDYDYDKDDDDDDYDYDYDEDELEYEIIEPAPIVMIDTWRPPVLMPTPPAVRLREGLAIPHARAAGDLPQSIVARGGAGVVILSLYENQAVRLMGFAGDDYEILANHIAFGDVAEDGWYYGAVAFAAARGLFEGMGDGLFAPQEHMTRAQFITVLARLDGTNAALFAFPHFDDVDIESWYGPAISWATMMEIIDYGILSEAPEGSFLPHDYILREEMAILFANYLAIRGLNPPEGYYPAFYDIADASPWARIPIANMRAQAIIHGMGDNTFNPRGLATRAEVAQIFENLVRALVPVNQNNGGNYYE